MNIIFSNWLFVQILRMKFISISAEIKVTIDVKIKVPPVPIFNWHPYWYLLLRFQNGRRFQWELRWPMVTIAVLTRAYSSWSRPFDHLDHVFIVLYRYLCSGQIAYIYTVADAREGGGNMRGSAHFLCLQSHAYI